MIMLSPILKVLVTGQLRLFVCQKKADVKSSLLEKKLQYLKCRGKGTENSFPSQFLVFGMQEKKNVASCFLKGTKKECSFSISCVWNKCMRNPLVFSEHFCFLKSKFRKLEGMSMCFWMIWSPKSSSCSFLTFFSSFLCGERQKKAYFLMASLFRLGSKVVCTVLPRPCDGRCLSFIESLFFYLLGL